MLLAPGKGIYVIKYRNSFCVETFFFVIPLRALQ
jgi:hypothetical protein